MKVRAGSASPRRATAKRERRRCEPCRRAGESYCEHNRVLLVHIDGAPVTIISETQESARLTANRLRVKLKGKPFNRRRTECTDSPN